MKLKSIIFTVALATGFGSLAQAVDEINITGATAFRAATINAIVAGYGGAASVGVVTSVTSGSYTGSNAISFRGIWLGTSTDTIIRCRFSGSTEGIRDVAGSNNVFYYPDTDIPAINNVTYKSQNSNPVGANVAKIPDVAFSDVQQTSSPTTSPTLASTPVGVVTFVFCKSQGSAANLSNVTDQAWKAVLGNNRGVPLNVFTGNSGDTTGRILATGRNDGSGTRAVYMIEPGVGVSTKVNQFKIGASGFNGVTSPGSTADGINFLQLWPLTDAEDVNNSFSIWNPTPLGSTTSTTAGNGGYFSGGNVSLVLTKDTSSVRVLGPTGTDLTSTGSYVGTTASGPRAVSVVAMIGTGDASTATATNNPGTGAGGANVLGYNGVTITPVPASPSTPYGLNSTDQHKVTNGAYTLWSYERMLDRGVTGAVATVLYGATTGIKDRIPANIAPAGIPLSLMVAIRGNDGEVVTQP